uniref:(northern house mosquito) hypothetical protein n=1 Tax=Culex pipiens TaxID=7175 RepID=A0A8D8FQS9_CULPI
MTNLLHQQFVVVTSYPGFSSKECNRNCQNQKHDDVATFVLQNDFVREDRKDANHHHLEEDEASEDSHVHWTTLINANDQQNRQNYIGQRRSHHKPKSCQNNTVFNGFVLVQVGQGSIFENRKNVIQVLGQQVKRQKDVDSREEIAQCFVNFHRTGAKLRSVVTEHFV